MNIIVMSRVETKVMVKAKVSVLKSHISKPPSNISGEPLSEMEIKSLWSAGGVRESGVKMAALKQMEPDQTQLDPPTRTPQGAPPTSHQ